MSGDILTVKTVKRVRSVRGSALVHIIYVCLLATLGNRCGSSEGTVYQ